MQISVPTDRKKTVPRVLTIASRLFVIRSDDVQPEHHGEREQDDQRPEHREQRPEVRRRTRSHQPAPGGRARSSPATA